MSTQYRRQVLRQATGPTESEFAASGATLLVGWIQPRYPDRIAKYYALTPVDKDYTRFEYLDALPVLTGGIADVFRKSVPPDPEARAAKAKARLEAAQARQQDRALRKDARQENRTGLAAQRLLNWFESEGGDVAEIWTAPGKGAGFFFDADDEFTLRAIQDKARSVARDPRWQSYYTVVPTAAPGKFLVAFLTDPRLTPVETQSALELALAATKPVVSTREDIDQLLSTAPELAQATPMTEAELTEIVERTPVDVSIDEQANEITVTPTPGPTPGLFPPRAAGLYDGYDAAPIPVGNIGDFFRKTFGPKKPEKIKKKIEKLEGQLTYWKEKLAEAEASAPVEGLKVGNILGGRSTIASELFGRAARNQGSGWGGSTPEQFSEAEVYEPSMPDMYGTMLSAGLEEMGLTRDDAESLLEDKYIEMLTMGQIDEATFEQLIEDIDDLSDDELADAVAELQYEVGFFGAKPMTSSPIGLSSFSGSPSSTSRGGRRGRGRRRMRKMRRRMRRRGGSRGRRGGRGGGGGGGGSSYGPPQPQVIVIREGGGGGGYEDEGYDDEGYDDGYEDEYVDGVTIGRVFAGGGVAGPPNLGRVYDVPRSPHGFSINYPAG